VNSAARVLIVDDEPAVLEGVRLALRREPYEIVTTDSAAKALEFLGGSRVDVVVSDERMPGMRGSAFLASVRLRYPDTIRIMLTGQASLEAAIRAINDGEVFRFLLKPCQPADLAQAIRSAFLQVHTHRQAARLLIEFRKQARLLRDLEHRHPGLLGPVRDADGTLSIDPSATPSLEELLSQMNRELDGAGSDPSASRLERDLDAA
jgi:two-component system, probable response regulator PhcQ